MTILDNAFILVAEGDYFGSSLKQVSTVAAGPAHHPECRRPGDEERQRLSTVYTATGHSSVKAPLRRPTVPHDGGASCTAAVAASGAATSGGAAHLADPWPRELSEVSSHLDTQLKGVWHGW